MLVESIRWQDTLWWEDDGFDLIAQFRSLSLRGYPASVVDKEQIKLLEPHLFQALRQAILMAKEGAAEAQRAALAVLAEVESNGGYVRGGVFLQGITQKTGRICFVETDAGHITCDAVVLATWVAAQHAPPGLDWKLPMANKHGIILKTNVLPQAINHTLMMLDVHFDKTPTAVLLLKKFSVVRLTRT